MISDVGGDDLRTAYENLSAGKARHRAHFIPNYGTRQTVMVIGITSSATQFQNSYDHERKHLEAHIAAALGIDPWGRGELLPFRGDRTADVRKGKVDAV